LKDFAKIESALEEVGLGIDALDRYPSEFSGGQRQRIGICRSLMLDPEIVIADEAVSALDVSVQAQILELLMTLKEKRNLSLIFISHDVAVVRQLSDRIILLFKGRVVEELPSDCLLKDASHPYTNSLLTSALYLREGGKLSDPLDEKEGKDLIDGCPYRPFCKDSFEKCSEAPAFFQLHQGHRIACWKYEKE
jgi:oligopeptide/dipeptide ABC transporter ATP-binding protein